MNEQMSVGPPTPESYRKRALEGDQLFVVCQTSYFPLYGLKFAETFKLLQVNSVFLQSFLQVCSLGFSDLVCCLRSYEKLKIKLAYLLST